MTETTIERKIVEPILVDPERDKTIRSLETLASILDNRFQIPGTNIKFGIDALVGLVPGIGDIIGSIFSFYIVYMTAKLGVRKRTLFKMFANITIDSIVGAVPILGDLFDVAWKSNKKNVQLAFSDLEKGKLYPRKDLKPRKMILLFGVGLLICLIFLIVAITLLLVRIF